MGVRLKIFQISREQIQQRRRLFKRDVEINENLSVSSTRSVDVPPREAHGTTQGNSLRLRHMLKKFQSSREFHDVIHVIVGPSTWQLVERQLAFQP